MVDLLATMADGMEDWSNKRATQIMRKMVTTVHKVPYDMLAECGHNYDPVLLAAVMILQVSRDDLPDYANVHDLMLTVLDELRRSHAGTGGFFWACHLREEISLTSTPVNPAARVLRRHRHSPVVEAYDLANAGVSKCAEIAKVLAAINREQQRPRASVHRIRVWLVGRE